MNDLSNATIFFYFPRQKLLASQTPFPNSIENYWQWQTANAKPTAPLGRFHWVLQSCLILQESGCKCELTSSWPEHGIVIAHRDDLRGKSLRSENRTVICLQVDRHPDVEADYFVVHNPLQADPGRCAYFIPPWPQIDLAPRDRTRADRFENAAYFGYPGELAPELTGEAWSRFLEELGLKWRIVPPESWNDFQDTDVIIAIRRFNETPSQPFRRKSAIKLVNAWGAGVPAILGGESAFQALRKDANDYLEVRSFPDLQQAVLRLKEDPGLRRSMAENGLQRFEEYQIPKITALWKRFLEEVVITASPSRVCIIPAPPLDDQI